MSKARRRLTIEDVQQPLHRWFEFVGNSAGTFAPEDEEWLNIISSTLAPSGIFESDRDVVTYRLGHYLGWASAKRSTANQPAQESPPPTKKLSAIASDLWLKEYDRCRDHGAAVSIACKVADEAVMEISKRMGKQEKTEPSGKVKLASDVCRWDGNCLDVMVAGQWEFAASANIHGEWFTYTPNSMGGRVHRSGKIDRATDDSEEVVKALAMSAAMLALDWESYGLKRPEGL